MAIITGTEGDDRYPGELEGTSAADKILGLSTPDPAKSLVDFSRSQGDKVHLAGIDANQQSNGNQAFKFVGQGPLTGPGQLRAYEQNGDTIVEGDTSSATEGPELRIVLDTSLVAKATDFVL
jgi:serralysin